MDQYDYIVIGGGSAGCAVTGRLAQDGTRTVCLVEAGGRKDTLAVKTPGLMPFIGQRQNYRYQTVRQRGLNRRRGYQPRGRGLGGSSAINAMLYLRGVPWDYDNWAALGCTGWSWDEVLPWFRKSEANERGADEWHGAGGPLFVSDQHHVNPASHAFVDAAASLQLPRNVDFNGARQAGFGLFQVTQHRGERWSAGRAFVEPVLDQPNVHWRGDTLVERLVIEEGRVTGVVVRRGDGRRTLTARRGVILSAGAFNSPQILMLSGIGPAAHLRRHGIAVRQDRPAVGADLHDHVDYVSIWRTASTVPVGYSAAGLMRMVRALIEHRRRGTGPMTTPYAEAGGFLRLRESSPAPDIQWHFVPVLLEDHGRTRLRGHGISLHACVLRPASRGSVRLANSDAAAPPLIDPAFLTDPADIALLREGVRLSHRIAQAPALQALGPTDLHPVDLANDEALDRLIRERADTIYHPVGSCRMGGDEGSVVDPKLRARGLERLWIADASIMPQIVGGNTNAPTIMIGERCADFVLSAERT